MAERNVVKADKTILDNFYKLVHTEPNVRLRAGVSTIKILASLQKGNQKKFNENLNYCIERLVSGLSSSRALARRGFGALLLEILKTHQITTDRLLAIASQKFGPINKDASKDVLFGYYILLVVILKSSNYQKSKANRQSLEKIYKLMSQLRNMKSYLEPAICRCLAENYDIFYEFMLVDIPRGAFESDVKLNIFDLLLVILVDKKEPFKPFRDMSSSRLNEVCLILNDDRILEYPWHPIFTELAISISRNFPGQFDKIYQEILFPRFFRANHNELASHGLKFISHLMEAIDDIEIIKSILNDHLIRLLVSSLRTRNPLNEPSKKFFQTLKALFKSWSDKAGDDGSMVDTKQESIIAKLTSSPGSLAFDEDSKSNCLKELLEVSTRSVLDRYASRLMLAMQKKTKNRSQLNRSIARQLAFISRRPQISDDIMMVSRISKFLLVSSMFSVSIDDSDDKLLKAEAIPIPPDDLDESTRVALRNAYHSTLDSLTSVGQPSQRIERLSNIICFIDQLLCSSCIDVIDESQNLDRIKELWSAFKSVLSKHESLIKKEGDPKQLYPITSLMLLYGLQIVEHGLECTNQIEELAVCAQGALNDDSNDGSWADVVTDQIIALLSATECNPWVRKLCESVFGSLLPHISQTSIDVLCDALVMDDQDGEVTDEEGEEHSSDDNSEIGESTNVDGESTSSVIEDHSLSEQNSDDQESSDKEEGQAMDCDESDEEKEEYLDDEQMMKLDKVIADMFRLNKKSKKNKRGNTLAFRLRCLDLVRKILMKKSNDQDTVDTVLDAIIPLATASRRSHEMRPVWEKVCKVVKKMPSKGKHQKAIEFLAKSCKA